MATSVYARAIVRVSPSFLYRYLRAVYRFSFPLLLLTLFMAPDPSYAQGSIRDTSITLVPITLSYAYQLPGGEMAQRFGANSNIGLSAGVKFKSNFLLGLEGGYIFGNAINEPGILSNVITSTGDILDLDGQPASVILYERGYTVMLYAGKIIPVAGPNPNSGLLLKLGVGYMRHKIRVESQNNVIPQLEGDYLEGYDRLAAGPASTLFVGYQHFGNRKLVNFVIGFEMTLGITEPLRAYNFDTGKAEKDTRYDGLTGFRVGWTLPIYKQPADKFYLY